MLYYTGKISEVPTKIMKEIAGLECRIAKIFLARSARSDTEIFYLFIYLFRIFKYTAMTGRPIHLTVVYRGAMCIYKYYMKLTL